MSVKKENIFILCAALAGIAAISAGVLATVDQVTRGPRAAAAERVTTEAMRALQPALDNDPDSERATAVKVNGKWGLVDSPAGAAKDTVVDFYPARRGGELLSVIGRGVSAKGYGGPITVMLAMKPDGAIENVVVTANNETPGLGTAATDRVRQKTIWGMLGGGANKDETSLPPNQVLDQFNGLTYTAESAGKWKVAKDGGDMVFVTGATISSRAVVEATAHVAEAYSQNREQLATRFAAKGK